MLSDLMEDLIDKVDIVSCREEDAVHHVVNTVVLLLYAAQAGVAGPAVRQCAAV